MNRQPRRLNVAGAGHTQRLRFGIHGADKRIIAARIMVREARGGAVLRGHQRQQQHIFTANLAVEAHAGVDPFHLRRVADIDSQHFIQRQVCVQHHHRRHQLGD